MTALKELFVELGKLCEKFARVEERVKELKESVQLGRGKLVELNEEIGRLQKITESKKLYYQDK